MSSFEDLIKPNPHDAEKRLAAELERFSFGAAVSPIAEVTAVEGPDKFVRTVVRLGGISLDHAQHPETKQQNVILLGEGVPEAIEGRHYVFDTTALILMPGFGPPAHAKEVTEVANTIQSLNDTFEAEG